MPGSWLNCSFVAELISSRSAWAALAFVALAPVAAGALAACALAVDTFVKASPRTTTSSNANIPLLRIVNSSLSVNSALLDRVGHAVDCQHVGRDPVVDLMGLGETDYVIERAHHNVFKLIIHHRLFPEVALPVLHPLE